MLVILLVFSELNVSVAEMSVADPTEPEIECEEQLVTDSEENQSTQCEEQSEPGSEENSATEGEEQPESESDGNSATEGEEQSEPEDGEDLTTEGEEQSEPEDGKDLTTEGEEQPESENEENLANACESQSESDSKENPEIDCEEQKEPYGKENPEIECEEGFYLEEELAIEGEEQLESNNEKELAAEGEGHLEPNNEKELAAEGEKQLESNNEEKLAAEGEEQLESNNEKELAAEGEEQLESNNEKELATEGEKQLESNDEEELAAEGEKQLGSNDEEELAAKGEKQQAPKCKRAILQSEGMLLRDVGKIGDINFVDLGLDSPNELDGFTQMETNKGLPFTVKGENEREYYMYFGDINNARSKDSLGVGDSYINRYYDDWNRPLPDKNTTLESLVSKKYVHANVFQVMLALGTKNDDHSSIMTYFYNGGRPSTNPLGSGLVIAHGPHPDARPFFQSQAMPMLKLFKNETKQELIAYAAVINGNYLDGYIKIKMSAVNKKGRINVSMKYLKLSAKYKFTNFAYSAHMDIGHRHTDSRMYSLGNDRGFYFNEHWKGKEDSLNIRDGRNYVLYFFRDGYANHPTQFRPNDNEPSNYPFSSEFFPAMSSSGIKDIVPYTMYNYTWHPGWALRWDPDELKPGSIREANLEVAVTEKLDIAPEIQLDNNHGYTDDGYRISGTWKDKEGDFAYLYYEVDGGAPNKAKMLFSLYPGEDNDWEYTIPMDQVKKGLDHDITVYVVDDDELESPNRKIKIRPTLTITNQVLDKDGKELKEIAPGETLRYEISVKSGYISEDKGTYGQFFRIIQEQGTQIEQSTDLKIIDGTGQEIKEATYIESPNGIVVMLPTDLPRSTEVKVTYNAKVKEDAAEGEVVKAQATASGQYSTGDGVSQTSNKVEIPIIGVLKFNSAPQEIDFGGELKISPRNKTYRPIKVDTPLTVKDSRPLSSNPSWTMTAKLDKQLTTETGSRLEGLQYRYRGNVSPLTEDASVQIYQKETKNSEVVNISDTWETSEDGLYLEVRAGTAKADAYAGVIKWELQNVPPNR